MLSAHGPSWLDTAYRDSMTMDCRWDDQPRRRFGSTKTIKEEEEMNGKEWSEKFSWDGNAIRSSSILAFDDGVKEGKRQIGEAIYEAQCKITNILPDNPTLDSTLKQLEEVLKDEGAW